jgi:hypothetical protein
MSLRGDSDALFVYCRYVETTHAPTHVQFKLRIKSVLKIARPDEEKFKDVFQSVNNHKVRWLAVSGGWF